MKKFYILISLLIIIALIGVGMALSNRDKTRHYRGLAEIISSSRKSNDRCQKVNFQGFQDLRAHGSGLINFKDFKKNFKYDPKKLYVINLLEGDIYYYKERCLWWYGLKYTQPNLGEILDEKPNRKFGKIFVRLIYGSPPVDDLSNLQTERELFTQMGAHYFMPLKNDPDWLGNQSYIDDLVAFFNQLPEDAHLYIHCMNGRGRTTTFLVLYDIFKNGKKMPLSEIVNRHYCIGREDLFNTTVWRQGNWTREGLEARKALIENFYAFMTSPDGYPQKTWAQWCAKKGITTQQIKNHR